MPTLVIRGDDDRIVPIRVSVLPASKIANDAQLIVYEGGSHGICSTEKNRVCADQQAYIRVCKEGNS